MKTRALTHAVTLVTAVSLVTYGRASGRPEQVPTPPGPAEASGRAPAAPVTELPDSVWRAAGPVQRPGSVSAQAAPTPPGPAPDPGPQALPVPGPGAAPAAGPAPDDPDASSAAPAPAPFGAGDDAGGPPLWVSAEYLLWWVRKGPNTVPLATTGSLADALPGALGQPGTRAVLGGPGLDYGTFSGGRLTAGSWLDPQQTWGVEASGFLLDRRSVHQAVRSDPNGNPPLFRPVTDVTSGENFFFLAVPGFVSGSMALSSSSRLWGAEANVVASPLRGEGWRVTGLCGYRHLDLEEGIDLTAFSNDFGNFFGTGFLSSPSNPGMLEPIGSMLTVVDSFHARNQFNGGQAGARAEYLVGRIALDAAVKVALGATRQNLDVVGITTQTQPGLPTATFPGGVLATAGNGGHFVNHEFSVVPEAQVGVGYQVASFLRGFAAYDFLYWTNVARPGDQIDLNVDLRGIPTATTFIPGFRATLPPPAPVRQTDFWAQGVSFGLDFQF